MLKIALKLLKNKITINDLYRFLKKLVPEDNRKQNPDEFYTNKYQKTCCFQLW